MNKKIEKWIPFVWKLEKETGEYGIFSTTETHDKKSVVGKFKKGDYRKIKDGKFELRIGSKVEWIKAPTGAGA